MGKLVNIEESTYVSGIIDQYAQNKVGQYSKYLNLTPTFVTYYSINQVQSRADTGTGSVVSERGYNSPLRFNKIKGLPVYNLPVLSPDIVYDETGMDIDLDLSDIVLLPNTVKPTVPDYMLVELPDSYKILFRVNNFKHNTIQSNDFTSISLDIKATGPDADASIEPLVVKTFYTVFDNIGTEDKCFIEEEDIKTVNNLVKAINECIDTYNNLYWDHRAGAYLLRSQIDSTRVIYDVFLTRFIVETDIFPHPATTLTTLALLDYVPVGSDLLYKRSLLYAIQKRTKKFLSDKMYYYLSTIQNQLSPLVTFGYNALSVKPLMFDEPPIGDNVWNYYDSLLKRAIINNEEAYPTIPEGETDNLPEIETLSEVREPKIVDEYEAKEYRNDEKRELTDEDIELIKSYDDDKRHIFDIFIHYMSNIPYEIDPDKIIYPIMTQGKFSYFYTPLLIYIMKNRYDQYFADVK